MIKKSIGIILGVLLWSFAQGQGAVNLIQSAEARALGGSQAGAFGLQSIFGNPAGLAKVEGFGAIATAESRIIGTGINFGGAGVAIPSDLGVFGVGVGYYGISAYNEQSLAASYSRMLFKSFALSVQAKLFNTNIQEYGSQFNVSGTLGIQTYLNKAITIGAYIQNPIRIEVVPDQFLPTVFSLGAQYKFPDKLSLLFSIEKDLEDDLGIQAGLEYQPADPLFLRVGINSYGNELSFGLAYKVSETIRLDAAAAFHQVLGLSSGFSFIYQKK